ncbi:MAG: N-acetylglucosamine-6-phosphate deacetylase [Maribacter sp.]|nr:N-acetylglucosamine-6-phosphate deacetylase [Maribacter sp.]
MENDYYFDIQVNGYAGVDFNRNDLSLEGLEKACLKLKDDRVEGILATIITASFEDMVSRLKRLVSLREQSANIHETIKGFHIEGPFLNSTKGYRGAHPKEHILDSDVEKMKILLDAANGLTRIVTLAPEIDKDNQVTKYLYTQGITISAGHCNPELNALQSAIDAGLSMFTHLGNGCPQDLPRHDNIIQKALSLTNDLKLCFIADGIHIPFYALKNYIQLAGAENCIVTTDAMAAAGARAGRYSLSHIELEVGEDRIVREPGKPNFAGSAIDMKSSALNLKTEIGLSDEEITLLTYTNPSKLIKA